MYLTDGSQGFGFRVLNEEADHSLPIIVLAWASDRGAPPHDHGTWAVIAGVDGAEKNTFHERVDDRSRSGHAELRPVAHNVCNAGDVVAIPTVASGPFEAVCRAPTHPNKRALVAAIPVPMRRERPPRIEGERRDPDTRICRFDGRCLQAIPRCRETSPLPKPAGPVREVACHHAEV